MKRELLLVSCLLAAVGCGYSLVGTGSSAIPPTVKTVYVPTFINDTGADAGETATTLRTLVTLLHPIAPHLSEELNERMGGKKSLLVSGWPSFDPALAVEEIASIAVQVSGKLRAEIRLRRGSSEKEALAAAQSEAALSRWLDARQIVKTIWVQDRLLNIVVK